MNVLRRAQIDMLVVLAKHSCEVRWRQVACVRALVRRGYARWLRQHPSRRAAITPAGRAVILASNRKWSAIDNARLASMWDAGMSLAEIAASFVRTEWAIYRQAQHLGFKMGVPDGYESLAAAVRRTGFCAKGLREILKWASVEVSVVRGRPSAKKSLNFYYVDPADVDDAVAEWLSAEHLSAAAAARGVTYWSLRKWLYEYRDAHGLEDRDIGKVGRYWHIATDLLDEVVTAKTGRKKDASLREVAA